LYLSIYEYNFISVLFGKVALILNSVPRRDYEWGIDRVAPQIPNFGTRWTYGLIHASAVLSPTGKGPGAYWRLGGPKTGLAVVSKRKVLGCAENLPLIIQPVANQFTD
jgi:hypothetical protein